MGTWSDQEVARLRKMRAEGCDYDVIAEALGRTKISIMRKSQDLRLRLSRTPGSGFQPDRGLGAVKQPAALSDKRKADAVNRAGKVTLPPLPSLKDV